MFHGVSRFSKGRACLVLILIVAVGLFWPGGKAWANDPPTPSGLAVANPTPPTGTSLVLTWNAVTFSGHAGASYRIDRRTGGGSYSELTTIANPLAVTYTDTGLSHSLYYYRIRSYDTHGDHSNWSSEVSARPNRPPVFTGAGTNTAQTVAEGAGLTAVAATDPDADTLTYSLQGGSLPAGIALQSTGAFTGTVGNLAFENGPTYTATIRASDPAGLYASTTLTITVTNANGAPSFTGASTNTAQTVAEGAGVTALAATDPDANPLTYTLQGGSLPAGITLQSDGSFSGTVGYSAFQNGPTYTATIRVSDPGALFADTTLVVTVTDTNRTPAYTGASANTAQTVAEGAGLTALAATDPDLDPLTYTLQGGSLPAGITLQADGSFSGTVDYLAFQNGPVYNATIRVSDGGLFADTALVVTVTDTNRAPAYTGASANTGQTVAEGAGLTTAVAATDPDLDTLTYSLQSGALPAGITLQSDGSFTGTVGYSAFESGPVYNVTIRVSDGALFADTALVVTVTDTNRAPAYTGAPTNTAQTVAEGAGLTTAVAATDPDLDTLTYSLQSGALPAGITLQSDGSFTGAVGYSAFESGPVYNVTIRVSDGALFADTALAVTVTDTNRAPVFGSLSRTIDENATPAALTATDADDDSLTFSLASGETLPDGLSLNPGGSFSGPASYSSSGDWDIDVEVTDGTATTGGTLHLVINNVNRTPVFGNLNRTINENQTPAALTATDADDDSLTFSLASGETLPDGLSLNAGGSFSGPASYGSSGDWDIDVEVTDGTDTTSGTLHLVINNVNRAPVFGNLNRTINENQTPAALTATDADDDSLTFSLASGETLPDGLSLNAGGSFSGPASYSSSGDWDIDVEVTDGTDTTSGTLHLVINSVNRAPWFIVARDGAFGYAENAAVSLACAATDPDSGDTLAYSLTAGPGWLSINNTTGAVTGTVPWDAAEIAGGVYTVTVRCTDGTAPITETFTLNITNVNRAPNFTAVATNTAQTIDEGAGLAALAATDPDSDTLTFTRTGGSLPPGITLQGSGTFSGTANHGSTYSVTIRVSDGSMTATTVLHVTVAAEEEEEAPAPPRVGPPLKTGIVITVVPGSHVVWVNGYPRDLDAPAYFGTPGRMMVPLRFISETVGAEVLWNPVTQRITIRGDWTTIVLTVGSRTAFVNGVAVRLDAPAVVLNGRAFVPLRFICEALGAQVDYKPSTHSARIQR
jgi:hypothetical protein